MPRRLVAVPVLCGTLLLNLLPVASASAFVTVGSGGPGACNFADLQTAIDSSPDNSELHVVFTYHGKPIKFQDKTLRIYGGYTDCTGATPSSNDSVLDGTLDSGTKPVLEINGHVSLDLRNFELAGGHNSGNAGGGIRFFSSGAAGHVELHDVLINNNRADLGGGIFYNGGASPGPDDLFLYDNVQVIDNFADHAGGGIRLEGNARLTAESPQTWISGNTANLTFANDGNGGGVQLLDHSSASIGSPGYNGLAVIYNNSARRGGGIAIQDDSVVRLFTTLPGQPARVEHNTATLAGGGVYLFPKNENGNGDQIPMLCGYGYGINDNTAANGGAIYGDQDTSVLTTNDGDNIILTRTSCNGLPANDAECVRHTPCNTIDRNTTTQVGGSTIRAIGDVQTQVSLEDVELRGNSGSHLLSVSGEIGLSLRNCVVAENRSSDSGVLIQTSDAEIPTQIDSCTITNNTLPGVPEISALQGLSLTRSIVWQAGTALRLTGAGALQLADVLAGVIDIQGFGSVASPNVNFADPQFIDPSGDYHLQSTSPAIDYATTGIANDLDGNARGIALSHAEKPFDVGAYERQTLRPVTFPPVESFEEVDPIAVELPFGWTSTVFNDTGVTSGWTFATDFVFDGSHAIHAADPDGVTDATLVTPAFTFAHDGRLSFHHRFDLDFFDNRPGGGVIDYFDGAVLEISVDAGPFIDLVDAGGSFVAGGYNATISTQWSSPIAGRAAWSADSGGWQKVVAKLPAAANGHSVKLRWRVSSDAANPAPGYWLDDVEVVLDAIFGDGFQH